MGNTRVVVIGGGYAGTLAANRLRQRPDLEITLVNPRPVFVERIRLHQLVTDTGAATADYGTLLGEGIQLVVDAVERIDTADRRLLLTSGTALAYDYLMAARKWCPPRKRCPVPPNSPTRSAIWKARSGCATRSPTCR